MNQLWCVFCWELGLGVVTELKRKLRPNYKLGYVIKKQQLHSLHCSPFPTWFDYSNSRKKNIFSFQLTWTWHSLITSFSLGFGQFPFILFTLNVCVCLCVCVVLDSLRVITWREEICLLLAFLFTNGKVVNQTKQSVNQTKPLDPLKRLWLTQKPYFWLGLSYPTIT